MTAKYRENSRMFSGVPNIYGHGAVNHTYVMQIMATSLVQLITDVNYRASVRIYPSGSIGIFISHTSSSNLSFTKCMVQPVFFSLFFSILLYVSKPL